MLPFFVSVLCIFSLFPFYRYHSPNCCDGDYYHLFSLLKAILKSNIKLKGDSEKFSGTFRFWLWSHNNMGSNIQNTKIEAKSDIFCNHKIERVITIWGAIVKILILLLWYLYNEHFYMVNHKLFHLLGAPIIFSPTVMSMHFFNIFFYPLVGKLAQQKKTWIVF